MVRFVQVGGLASIIAVASKAEPQPEQPISEDVLQQIANGWTNGPRPSAEEPSTFFQPIGFQPQPLQNILQQAPQPMQTIAIHGTPQYTPVQTLPNMNVSPLYHTPNVMVNNQVLPVINRPPTNYQPYQPPRYDSFSEPMASTRPEINFNFGQSQPESHNAPVTFTQQFNPGHGFNQAPPAQHVKPNMQAPTRYSPGGMRVVAPEKQTKSDMEHAQMINLGNPGVVQGTDVIKSIAYRADGNYKLEINFKGVIPLTFVNLVAGKCSQFTPGVSIVNKDNIDTTLEIDLALCQKECDLANDDLLSSIDVLNQPIDISFGIQDPDDFNRIIGQYKIGPNPLYHEDYILEFATKTEDTRQLVIDESGNFFQVDDNIQFSFMTFIDDNYDVKTYSTKASAPPGQTTYLEMCPTNGFTVGKMQNVPEICFIKDLTNEKTVMMWDMGLSDGCIKNLRYHPDTGNWQYPANYYHIMGYNSHHIHHNDFKITCNMRVCGNIAGNPCQQQIEHCDYVV